LILRDYCTKGKLIELGPTLFCCFGANLSRPWILRTYYRIPKHVKVRNTGVYAILTGFSESGSPLVAEMKIYNTGTSKARARPMTQARKHTNQHKKPSSFARLGRPNPLCQLSKTLLRCTPLQVSKVRQKQASVEANGLAVGIISLYEAMLGGIPDLIEDLTDFAGLVVVFSGGTSTYVEL
jgi:hypothetical protein